MSNVVAGGINDQLDRGIDLYDLHRFDNASTLLQELITAREFRRFESTYIKSDRENATDRKNRLIFIPDEDHLDDWCFVYSDGNKVDRAVLAPPED